MRRACGWASTVVAGALLLPGCGNSDEENALDNLPPKQLLARAAKQMVREGGAHFDWRVRTADDSFELHSEGRTLLGLAKVHVVETIDDAPNQKLVGNVWETVYYTGTLYTRPKGRRQWRAFHGHWAPADRLYHLPKAATALRDSGTERVLGVDTRRIDGIWDADKFDLEAPGRDRMPMTVWVDERRRIRQFRLKADLEYLYGAQGLGEATETYRFKRFDADIEIVPPGPRMISNWESFGS